MDCMSREYLYLETPQFHHGDCPVSRKKGKPKLVKGGAKSIQSNMVWLLAHAKFQHLKWPAWRCMGATMFIRNGATMQELMSRGREICHCHPLICGVLG